MKVTPTEAVITLTLTIAEAEWLEESMASGFPPTEETYNLERQLHEAIHAAMGKPLSPVAD